MQIIEFTSEERDLLREVLKSKLLEIEIEISRADAHDFKLLLKDRERLLEGMLAKLPALVPV